MLPRRGLYRHALTAYGLYIVRQAARHRDARHRETMTALENRHRESMAVLKAERESLRELIRRTSAPPAAKDS